MIQSVIFDSLGMNIKRLANSIFDLEIPIVLILSVIFLFLLFKKISTTIPLFTKALARVKLVNPSPNMHTFIIIFNFNNKN